MQTEEGRQVLAQQPSLLEKQQQSPSRNGGDASNSRFASGFASHLKTDGLQTLGGAVNAVMTAHGISLGERTPVKYIQDAELAYVMKRYREIHDLLHIVVGFPFSVRGEVAAKWFEFQQNGLPMNFLAGLLGIIKAERVPTRFALPFLSAAKTADSDVRWIAFAINASKKSAFFPGIFFEHHWEMDLKEFRRKYHLVSCEEAGLASLDALWDASCDPGPLIEHYEQSLLALNRQRKSDTPGAAKERAALFETALVHLRTRNW